MIKNKVCNLNVLQKNMNKKLSDKIKITAFQMFRDWNANAKKNFPNIDFTIVDESILVKDLQNSIKSAVKSLKNEEKAEKRAMRGFDIGYVWGFIYSNLNTRWIHEYIHKQSNDYKDFMALKAIQLYLDIEDIALIKIDDFYKKMYIEDVNFENIYFKPDKKQFKDFGSDVKINFENNRQNNITISLDNLITEKIVKITSEKDMQFLPKTEKYFSEEDVNQLIEAF